MDRSADARPGPPRRWIRAALLLVPAALFIALLARGVGETGGPPQPGEPAPAFEAPLLAGPGTLSLSELRGRPVVLNFWASWCVPCEEEAPVLRRAARVYGDRLAIVGVNIKDARSDALAFAREHDLDYQHVRDEGSEIYGDYGLTGQPETFFIDQRGEIVEHVPGTTTEENFFQLLDVLVSRDERAAGRSGGAGNQRSTGRSRGTK
ncbi:MAG: TlpA family protein disulfide reductase [Actinomycetota bacterium]